MQQFDDQKGKRRRLDISVMQENEVDDYYFQFVKMTARELIKEGNDLKEKIEKNNDYEWILAVKTKDGKLIGKIEVLSMGARTAFVTIEMPNESNSWKYGEDAIDQFIKICKENNYFDTIELEKNNSIVDSYVSAHGIEYEVKVA